MLLFLSNEKLMLDDEKYFFKEKHSQNLERCEDILLSYMVKNLVGIYFINNS